MDLNFLLFPAPSKEFDLSELEGNLLWVPVNSDREKVYQTQLSKTIREYFGERPKPSGSLERVALKISKRSSSRDTNARGNSNLSETNISKGLLDSDKSSMIIGPKPLFHRIENVDAYSKDMSIPAFLEFTQRTKKATMVNDLSLTIARRPPLFKPNFLECRKASESGRQIMLLKSPKRSKNTNLDIRAQIVNSHKENGNVRFRLEVKLDKKRFTSSQRVFQNREAQKNVFIQKRHSQSSLELENSSSRRVMGNMIKEPSFVSKVPVESESQQDILKAPFDEGLESLIIPNSLKIPAFNQPSYPTFQLSSMQSVEFDECCEAPVDSIREIKSIQEKSKALSKVKKGPLIATKGDSFQCFKKKIGGGLMVIPSVRASNTEDGMGIPSENMGIPKRKVRQIHCALDSTHNVPCIYVKAPSLEGSFSPIYRPPKHPHELLLVYFHGNGEDIFDTVFVCKLLSSGFRVG